MQNMSRNFNEHDDRGPSTSKPINYRPIYTMGGRRRKFGNGSGFSRRQHKGLDPDGDVDMWAANLHPEDRKKVSERYNPYSSKNQNRRKPKKHSGKSSKERHSSDLDGYSWYKVIIPFGKKSGKAFIFKSLSSLMNIPFFPICFQFIGNNAEFYVESSAVASVLKQLSRTIMTPDGFKMLIQTTRCGPPPTSTIDPEIIHILKTTMSESYDPISHSLNMSKWYHNETLKRHGLYLPLHRPVVLTAVIRIIKEHIPEIETFNLSNNKLHSLESASSLSSVCKQLKFVNLQNNRLRSIIELNHLKGLQLNELVIDGNPLCDDFKDKATYISAVRERFPKLMQLDGHTLPAPIGFDLGTEDLPASKKSFFAANEVKDLVIQFLDLYYSIYDSGDRSKLLDAYHDMASFSICLSKNIQKTSHGSLGVYNNDNRNLLTITKGAERLKLLKQGKLSVVNALQELPQTNHDPSSFSIDIFHVSPGLMSFSVIGVFKEVGAEINNATLKTFCRTFVVIPQGPGFVIVNETLFIAHASTEQQSKAFKVPAPTPSPSPAPPSDEKSPSEKQVMVLELSKQTGMNLDFSTKCLEENDWDFQRALAVFMKFRSEGKLPPEAFIHSLK